ncbi:MAG: biopolymer transporter ExbD [Gammaproteobacteria bacterium]|nr:biopolymer transporter ExbD [Gammaproteobacteria bacterium]MXW07060.1 biopolymer transporter ExbD [Gammaproteobacteria bacterium]MYC26207.1 biopolymer transporter ExbD [Gammaproteobacteria bacterium]
MNLIQEHNTSNVSDSQMIPLINVVFLMLAFILITGNIEKSNERNPELQELAIPSSTSNLDQEVHDVTVTLDKSGSMYIDETATNIDAFAEMFPLSASDITDAQVLIRADASVSAHATREVLKELRDLGLRRISLATVRAYSSD